MGQHPDWLYREVIEDTLPWNEAKECSFQEFSEKYTLHDAIWIGLFYDVAYENNVILAFIWDAVWLPDEIAQRTSVVAEWPLLFVKIGEVLRVTTTGYKDIGGLQRGIGRAGIEQVDGTNRLVIADHYGGDVEISFVGRLRFLGVDKDRRALPI